MKKRTEHRGKAGRTNQIDMLQGPLMGKILMFALPLAASSILQQLFNSADVAVVGRFAGSQALAAVGGNSSVISLLINLFVGLSVGANVVIANYIGQRKTKEAGEAVHTVMATALFSGVFLLILGSLAAKPILQLMNTPSDVIELASLYLRIYFLGMPFLMVYNFGAAVLRSVGDTRRPLYCLILSGIVNVCLNLFFVVVCGMSVDGVGIATVISNGISAGLVFYFLLNEDDPIRLEIRKIRIKKVHLFRMIKIGVPAGLQSTVFSLSNVCIQTAINSFGSSAVAGSAAAVNFEYFTYYVVNSFSQAAVTFTSQNIGAKQYERCKKVFRLCLGMGIVISGAMCTTFVLLREIAVRFYTVDAAAIEYAVMRVRLVESLAFLPATYEVAGAALRGMGHSMLPAVLTVIGSCGFRIMWIYTVFRVKGTFESLMIVYPVTWILTGTMVVTAYLLIRRRMMSN
ncbi:MAG: MATE family efflux transporter [Eubacteriales bacterium]|nr:MATE family efflux transporter [Eubacteriales bacterium]